MPKKVAELTIVFRHFGSRVDILCCHTILLLYTPRLLYFSVFETETLSALSFPYQSLTWREPGVRSLSQETYLVFRKFSVIFQDLKELSLSIVCHYYHLKGEGKGTDGSAFMHSEVGKSL